MEQRTKTELDEVMRVRAVLNKAFLLCNFSALVVVTNDPAYRSNLTSFTLEHVAVQTLTLFHFYRELTLRLGEELKPIRGPWDDVKTCNPYRCAMDNAVDVGRVCQATVYNRKNDFLENGFRFSESLVEKSIHEWLLDNPIMNEQAKAWLRSKVGRRPKKGQAHFVIRDFQTYLNQTFLKDWKVPKWKRAKAVATNIAKDSNFLQVF